MTLISSIVSPTAGFVAASDIILSKEAPVAPTVDLPLRDEGFSFGRDGRVLAGTAQKTSIFGRTLVQWTGSLNDCGQIITSLYRHSRGGEQHVGMTDCLKNSGLTPARIAELALIYHHIAADGRVESWTHNARSKAEGDATLFFEGSGLAQYIWNTQISAPAGTVTPAIVMGSALGRAGTHLLKEAKSNEAYADWFGGWIEFAWRGEQAFQKVPCAVKLWRIDGRQNIVKTDPYLFSYYVGYQLVIARIKPALKGKGISQARRLIHVVDVLNRHGKDVFDPANITHEPYVTFHLIQDDYKKEARTLQTFSYDTQGFCAELNNENEVELDWSAAFESRLRGGSSPGWRATMRR